MRTSISQITTVGASFAEDVAAYAAAGLDGIGLWEFELGDDEAAHGLLRDAGLTVTHCVPAVPSILPLPLMEGPDEPEDRVEAICAGIRRLAPFEPTCVLFLTGPVSARRSSRRRRSSRSTGRSRRRWTRRRNCWTRRARAASG